MRYVLILIILLVAGCGADTQTKSTASQSHQGQSGLHMEPPDPSLSPAQQLKVAEQQLGVAGLACMMMTNKYQESPTAVNKIKLQDAQALYRRQQALVDRLARKVAYAR